MAAVPAEIDAPADRRRWRCSPTPMSRGRFTTRQGRISTTKNSLSLSGRSSLSTH